MITKENARINHALSIKSKKANTVKRIKEAVFSLFHNNEKITYSNLNKKYKISNGALAANKDLIAQMKEDLLKEKDNKQRRKSIELKHSSSSKNDKKQETPIQTQMDINKDLKKLYIQNAHEHNEKFLKDAIEIYNANKEKIKNFFS